MADVDTKDPFQDVDGSGEAFVAVMAQALEARAGEEVMRRIVSAYLDDLDWPEGGLHVEVGTGTGAVARAMAARAGPGRVVATDPSRGLVDAGRALAADIGNLAFEVADGAALPLEDGAADNVVFHTVLSHVPDPSVLLAEAARVLRPGGRLVVCDGDFAKLSLSNGVGDPMQACAAFFAARFVTHPDLTARLRGLIAAAGFRLEAFRIDARAVLGGTGAMTWVGLGGRRMVEEGLIGAPLAEAMLAEHDRRVAEGSLYGFQPFVTAIAAR